MSGAGVVMSRDYVSITDIILRTRGEVDWMISALQAARDQVFPQAQKYDVIMRSCGDKKIPVIKEIRTLTGLGLKEAKDVAEAGHSMVITGLDEASAGRAMRALQTVGADVFLAPAP